MMLKFFFFLLFACPISAMEVISIDLPHGPTLSVEVARSISERQKGLSFRKKLPENAAMLFVYEQPQVVKMWMKDCSIALDMIFLNKEGKVVYIQENTVPFSLDHITSPPDTKYVLEVNAGIVKKYKVSLGDEIDIKK